MGSSLNLIFSLPPNSFSKGNARDYTDADKVVSQENILPL